MQTVFGSRVVCSEYRRTLYEWYGFSYKFNSFFIIIIIIIPSKLFIICKISSEK